MSLIKVTYKQLREAGPVVSVKSMDFMFKDREPVAMTWSRTGWNVLVYRVGDIFFTVGKGANGRPLPVAMVQEYEARQAVAMDKYKDKPASVAKAFANLRIKFVNDVKVWFDKEVAE